MRLINADALIARCGSWYTEEGTEEGFIGSLKDLLDMMPTIEERKKGKWIYADVQRQEEIDNGNYLYVCSECGHGDFQSNGVSVSFCWNCGADMRGDEGSNAL